MATNTRLVTFNAQNVTPQDDGLLYETAIPQTGIIYGADMTANGTNTVHIETGFGIVRGRFFEIFESDIAIPLSASGEIQGRIIGRLDLANIDEPFVILAQTGTLAPLRQDADVNIFNGVHEFLLATFVVNEITISNFADVKPTTFGSQTIVDTLPAEGVEGIVYIVRDGNELYQWVWDAVEWKPIGSRVTANTKDDDGIVKAGSGKKYKIWGTTKDEEPKWKGFDIKAGMGSVNVPNATFTFLETNFFTAEFDCIAVGQFRVTFASNSTGRRYIEMAVNGSGFIEYELPPANGSATRITMPFCIEMDAGIKLSVRVWQSSGTTLNVSHLYRVATLPREKH